MITGQESKKVYLDFNSSTPLAPEVIQSMTVSLGQHWSNPSNVYPSGKAAREAIDHARHFVGESINANQREIIFCSGGTEANNWVIHSAIDYFHSVKPPAFSKVGNDGPLPHIVASNIEHDSISKTLQKLAQDNKIEVTFVWVSKKKGTIDIHDIRSAIRPTTCLITVMLANNETGVIQPVREVCHFVRSLKRKAANEIDRILVHTDAAQALGKVEVDVKDLGVDYLTIVGHKMYGPRIGALYVNTGHSPSPLSAMLHGGGQEFGYRSGTENTPCIVGLGVACDLITHNLSCYRDHMERMRELLLTKLNLCFTADEMEVNCTFDSPRLPNVLSVSFKGVSCTGSAILSRCLHLEAGTGSACHAGSNSPSAILLALGVPFELATNTIRLSVGRTTTEEDIDIAVQDIRQAVCSLA